MDQCDRADCFQVFAALLAGRTFKGDCSRPADKESEAFCWHVVNVPQFSALPGLASGHPAPEVPSSQPGSKPGDGTLPKGGLPALRYNPAPDPSVPPTAQEARLEFLRAALRGPVPASVLAGGLLVSARVVEGRVLPEDIGKVTSRDKRVVMVMPTYDDPHKPRAELAEVAIESIRQQMGDGFQGPLTLVVADNGMSVSQRQRISAAAAMRGVDLHIADALPVDNGDRRQRTAAYARNKALKEICELARHDERFRGSSIALLDDDGAIGPGALDIMQDTMERFGAAAVTANATKTTELSFDRLRNFREQVLAREQVDGLDALRTKASQGAHVMPPMFGAHGVDMNSIVAFSGDVSTKTAFLLLRRASVDKLAKSGGPFLSYPHGSFEDMLLGLSLTVDGPIVRQGGAHYLDQVSTDNRILFRQKSRWGRDHVLAVNDFKQVGNVLPGLHIMEPRRISVDIGPNGSGASELRWMQWTIPASSLPRPDMVGFVLSPSEIRRAAQHLRNVVESQPDEIPVFFGPDFNAEKLMRGLAIVQRILRTIDSHRRALSETAVIIRSDLPIPMRDHYPDSLFQNSEDERAAYAQLAGNLMGMIDLLDEESSGQPISGNFPPAFLLGVRQNARWES